MTCRVAVVPTKVGRASLGNNEACFAVRGYRFPARRERSELKPVTATFE